MTLLFVFDMDDVLYDYDWRRRMEGLVELTGVPFAELRRRWWHDEGEFAAEAGGFPDADSYHRAALAAFGAEVSVEDWISNRRHAMTPFPDSFAAVARARELGAVSLLTNNGPLVHAHLATLAHELVDLFEPDDLRTSSFYGARKPDPLVFERMLESYRADPRDVFFADDLPENVASAAGLGITAHRFTDPAGLRAAIEDFASSRG